MADKRELFPEYRIRSATSDSLHRFGDSALTPATKRSRSRSPTRASEMQHAPIGPRGAVAAAMPPKLTPGPQGANSSKDQSVVELTQEVRRLDKDLQSSQSQVQSLKSELMKGKNELADARARASSAQTHQGKMSKQVFDLQKKLDEAEAGRTSVEEELKKCKEIKEAFEKHVNNQEDLLRAGTKFMNEKATKVNELQAVLVERDDTIATLKHEIGITSTAAGMEWAAIVEGSQHGKVLAVSQGTSGGHAQHLTVGDNSEAVNSASMAELEALKAEVERLNKQVSAAEEAFKLAMDAKLISEEQGKLIQRLMRY